MKKVNQSASEQINDQDSLLFFGNAESRV